METENALRELNHNNLVVPTANNLVNVKPPVRASGIISPAINDTLTPDCALMQRELCEPTFVGKYAHEIYEVLRDKEALCMRDPNYMQNQTEVTERMRMILIDWMVDVHLKFKLHPETFYLAVDIVDRYLMVQRGQRATLQLVGVSAILLAAKHEEIWPPEVKDCVYICANTYTRDDVLRMERGITEALSFRLTVPTMFPFLSRFSEIVDAVPQVRHLSMMFAESSALEFSMLVFTNSTIAAASLLLAMITNAVRTQTDATPAALWTNTVQQMTKIPLSDVMNCASQLLAATKVSMSSTSRYQAIKRKYLQPRFSEVARFELPESILLTAPSS